VVCIFEGTFLSFDSPFVSSGSGNCIGTVLGQVNWSEIKEEKLQVYWKL
jgi:hypothetical protein